MGKSLNPSFKSNIRKKFCFLVDLEERRKCEKIVEERTEMIFFALSTANRMVRNKQIRKKVSQTLPNAERGEEDEID